MSLRAAAALPLALLALAAASPVRADPCGQLPPDVAKYLKTQPKWALLTTANLIADDRRLWLASPRGRECPGFASAGLDGGGERSYALVLLPRGTRGPPKVVLLRRMGRALLPVAIPTFPGRPPVVWTAAPGPVRDRAKATSVRLRYDSVVVEYIEASAVQYYVDKGRLKQITIAD